MSSSIFGAPQPAASNVLLQMKAGKLTQSGTTVTADPRKGLLLLQKSDDDLMHLIWKDRSSNTVEDDLIIFQGDATLKHLPQCKTGYAMLLEFTTGRKSLFWSQEPRKKGIDWEDIAKESELMNKANGILNGSQPPAAAPSVGFGGMTHSELLAMLSGGAAPAAAQPAAAEPSTPAPAPAPATTDAAAPEASSATPAAAATAFSADSIANILGNITPAAPAPAPAPAAAAGGGAFSADSIASILGNIAPPPQVQPLSLNAVLAPDAAQALVDGEMERRLAEHLPQGGAVAESVRETLATPQISQAAARLTEALHTGDAAGLVMELGLNPNYGGLGVEPFLRALQEATPKPSDDAAGGSEEEKPDDKDGPAPMEE